MLRKSVTIVVAMASLAGGCKGKEGTTAAGPGKKASAEDLKTDEEKAIYAFGAMLGMSARPLSLSPAEVEVLKKGFGDTAGGGEPAFAVDSYRPKLQALARERAAAQAGTE